jgi:transposase
MKQNRPVYTLDYRQKIVELVRSGRSVLDVAREFNLSEQTVRNWRKHDGVDEGRHGGLTISEREELTTLRRENKQLRIEREILKKAAAWFARETDAIPSKSSDS